MFTPPVRFILLVLLVATASLGAAYHIVPLLIVASVLSICLLWGYFKMGTVSLAISKMRKNDIVAAKRILELTKYPDRLIRSQKAYYYYLQAYIAHNNNELEIAKPLFERAIAEGLKVENDRAICLLALSDIALVKGRKEEAKKYFYQMKDLKVQQGLMLEIRKMQQYLEQ